MKSSERSKMIEYFKQAEIDLTETQINQFATFYDLFIKYNDIYDLSRLKNFDDIILKHFIDSCIISKFIKLPDSLVDIGTGPGFPGLPLKILNPHLKIIFAEPRHKRIEFIEMVLDTLNLENCSTYPHKVNEESYFEVDAIITRAFEETAKTLKRAERFLSKGGYVILLKGPNVDKDLENIDNSLDKSFSLDDDISYNLIEEKQKRRLLVYRKESDYIEKTYLMMKEFPFRGKSISSPDNKTYKAIKKDLLKGSKSNLTIVSGLKLIKELYNKYPEKCRSIFIYERYTEKDKDFIEILNKFEVNHELYLLKKSLFNEIDLLSSNQPIMLIEKLPSLKIESMPKNEPILAIPFQDPQNTGAVIRSAISFGIKNIILFRNTCDPFHPKSIRSSSGSVYNANFYKTDKLENLRNEPFSNYPLFALDAGGEAVSKIEFPDSFILLPGVEGPGLPHIFRDNTISIEMTGDVESINASTAASIAMYNYYIKKM